jgi:hypothetical protein
MRLTTSGGFFSALSAPMSFAEIEFNASTAASSAGFAAAKSRSASSFTMEISSAFAETPSTMTATRAFSFSAMAVEAEISLRRSAASFCATARSLFFCVSSICMFFTSAFASNSLFRPLLILSASCLTSSSFR